LHGGYNSFNNLDLILKEKIKLEEILGENIIGYRNHFLRFKIPETWELLRKAGFKYDTTLSYAEMIGFRNGMCHPFKPFNLNNNREIDVLEIPLVIQDGTLRTYMNLNMDKSWLLCKKLIDTTKNMNGVITFVWHNHFFDDVLYKGWKNFYEKILNYSNEKNAWLTSGGNIFRWWTRKT